MKHGAEADLSQPASRSVPSSGTNSSHVKIKGTGPSYSERVSQVGAPGKVQSPTSGVVAVGSLVTA
jgi:hypothetical protein